MRLDGGETCTANLRLIRLPRRKMSTITLTTPAGKQLEPISASKDRIDFLVPASGQLILVWE